jgi:hypothetical protein
MKLDPFTPREEHGLTVLENRMLRRLFAPEGGSNRRLEKTS